MKSTNEIAEKLVFSNQRVADHGEVFTPAWLVDAMLDLVKDETEQTHDPYSKPVEFDGFRMQLHLAWITEISGITFVCLFRKNQLPLTPHFED